MKKKPLHSFNLEEGEVLYQNGQKKFRASGENQTHDPPSVSSDVLTAEPLEALWRAGSKFNVIYVAFNNYYYKKR